MKCPSCNSDEVDQTTKFDLVDIDNEQCTHEFECMDCGCLFTITYQAIDTTIIEESEDEI